MSRPVPGPGEREREGEKEGEREYLYFCNMISVVFQMCNTTLQMDYSALKYI